MSKEKFVNYEMSSDDPKDIAEAVQRGFIKMLRDTADAVRKETKVPGLTWEQIDYLFKAVENNKPQIIVQEREL